MKVIAVFAAVLAVSTASPQILFNGLGYTGLGYPSLGYSGLPLHHGLTYAAAPAIAAPAIAAPVHHVAPVATKTQYHAQDELGQASFGHSEPGQAHAAVRDAAGGVRGTFSYISPEGQTLTTHYIADHNGYRVASNALPVSPAVHVQGPIDTPEVQAAKAQHFAAHAAVRAGRQKRGVIAHSGLTYASPFYNNVYGYNYGFPSVSTYSNQVIAAPAVTYAHTPALTYAAHAPVVAAPAITTYAAAPAATVVAAPAHHVVAAPAVRPATLTKVVNTPGHAVSYRVD